jgi:hypothetical protein
MRTYYLPPLSKKNFKPFPLVEAYYRDSIWNLDTEDPEVIFSLTCKRAPTSRDMGWKQVGGSRTNYIGTFPTYTELRKNLERLVMRACTYDYAVESTERWVLITATDPGYRDRLPPLLKHSKLSRSELAKLNSEEAAAVASN